MKKEIATLLLASTLLAAPLTACQQTPAGEDKIDNTTTESTTTEVPETTPTSSNAYEDILKQFQELLLIKKNYKNYDTIFVKQYNREDEILNILIQATYDVVPTKAGYCIKDINGDGTDELILLDENYYIYVLFTIVDGHIKIVDTFQGDTNHIGAIGPDGTIYKSGYSKGENHYAYAQKISENGELAGLSFWCKDESVYIPDVDNLTPYELQYFKEIDGVRTSLDKESFNALYLEYTFALHHPTEITKQSGIEFTSMNLENPTSFSDLESYKGTWYTSAIPPDDLTITSVSEGKIECHLRVLQLDAFDDFDLTVTLQDGKYIFTDKNELISGTMQFKEDSILVVVEQSNTDDLQSGDSWSFTIKDTIVRTIYSSSNSDGSDKVVCKYEYSKSGSMVYLQIDAWNQTLVLPFTFKHIVEIKFAPLAATIVGDKGFFVYHPDHSETSIKILSFTKGSDEITEQTITWDTAICQNQIFCNFIDDENGYIFVTEEIDAPGFSRGAEKVAHLYKTQDGGKTWASVNCDSIPYISLRESLVLAKFVTEDIAIIAGRIWATDCNLHERTYITQDGGLTWNPILLPYPLNGEWDYSEVVDMVLIDDCYYLTVKSSGNNRKEMQFWSKNLTNWMLVPNSENDLGPNQSISSVLYENDGKVYLQIGAWNQTLEFPFTYTEIKDLEFSNATAIFGDKGIFVYHPDGLGTSIKILSFAEGSDEITEQTITWDEPIYENQIFCNFVDDKNGYIFVIEEGGHSDFAYGYQKVSKLYKTQDGGKTWTSIDCSNAPYTNLRECMILAKFATEDIGIIAGRHWASDYSFHKRTYITKDGGISWIPVDLSNFFAISPDKDWGIQAYDLQYIDGTYYLYVQAVHEGTGKPCYLFTSSDGVEWNYLKQVN